jgi:anaerobic ribonucleoside-triphosphate reductase activating protein
MENTINLQAVLPRSRANGPGMRLVAWFQGCSLGCPGCFNPATHGTDPHLVLPVAELADRIARAAGDIEGITLSGGEPLQQPDALLALLRQVRGRTDLSVLLFSGYTLDEIRRMPCGSAVLDQLDVLIAGRYDRTRRLADGLRGSANQRIHLLTDRYTLVDIESTPAAELVITPDGRVITSGISPPPEKGDPEGGSEDS